MVSPISCGQGVTGRLKSTANILSGAQTKETKGSYYFEIKALLQLRSNVEN